MADTTTPDLRRELLLGQAVKRRNDVIVRKATETVLLLEGNRDMEVSQLRNLLNVAVESESIEVVINFIRYQIARGGRAWGTRKDEFGHTVIADLRGPIAAAAGAVVKEVGPQLPDADGDRLQADAYMRLVQLYLGYLQRSFYFAKRTDSFAELKEVPSV